MEKQLVDIRTFIGNLPVLDIAETWTLDPNTGLYRTETIKKHRTKKEQEVITLTKATDKHPETAQLVTVDKLAGYWSEIKYSGALPRPIKNSLLENVEKLIRETKSARERANSLPAVNEEDYGQRIFNLLLAPIKK